MHDVTTRRLIIAAALSALLHLALVWLALHRSVAAPKPPPSKALTVEFFVEPDKAPVPPAPVVQPPPAPPPPTRVTRAPARVPSPRPQPLETPPAAPSDTPAAPGPASDTPVISDVPRLTTLVPFDPSLTMAMPDAGPDVPRPAQPTAAQLVQQLATSTLGRGRVERGLVHPYYSQLGKTLIAQWNADRVVAQGGLKNYAEQVAQNTRIFNELWLQKTEQFGKTGNPLSGDFGPSRRAPANDRIQALPGVDFEARKELSRELKNEFKATRRATFRVVQNAQGQLTSVELVDPSNDPKVDAEALVDVKAAAEKLPPPPPEIVGADGELRSLWSFELVISISPPIPTVSFEFDEALGTIDTRLPLDRRIYKRVRLLSVE